MGDLFASARLAAPLIKRLEGCVLTAYPDPATAHLTEAEAAALHPPRKPGDPWTIGYGATGPHIQKGTVWSQAQADDDLADTCAALAKEVSALVHTPLSPESKSALISFVYNVGVANFRSSTLLRLINAGKPREAIAEFGKWNRAGGKVFPGLVKRRAVEAATFEAGLSKPVGG